MHDQTLIRHTHLNTLVSQYLNLSSAAMKILNIARRSILRIEGNKHSNLDFIELERSVHGLTLLDEVREVKPLFSLAGITKKHLENRVISTLGGTRTPNQSGRNRLL